MTAVRRTETATQTVEATPAVDLAAEGVSAAPILGELLRVFGDQESLDHFAATVVDILARGLRLEGAVLQVREETALRVAAAAGLGGELGAIPPVSLDALAWPAPGTGLVSLPPEVASRLLPAVLAQWRALHGARCFRRYRAELGVQT